MTVSVGIDFGTTTTVVALTDQGRTEVSRDPASQLVRDPIDDQIMPSVVSFHPSGQVLAGRAARARRMIDPSNTITSVKRIIGLPWHSSVVKEFRRLCPMELECGPEETPRFVTRAGKLSATEVASYLFGYLREQAWVNNIGDRQIIVTVPPSFHSAQGMAIAEAARRVGFDKVDLVSEAYAAALPYVVEQTGERLIVVYDLGGGTFDLAVLRCSGRSHQVLAFGGDPFLGGDDIDLRLAEWAADKVLEQHRWDLRSDKERFKNLLWACEQGKIRLSDAEQTEIRLTPVDPVLAGKSITIRREHVQGLLHDLVQRTFVICDDTLGRAAVAAGKVDAVVLAGGGTYIPAIRAAMRHYFSGEIVASLPPDKIVAMGASMAADLEGR